MYFFFYINTIIHIKQFKNELVHTSNIKNSYVKSSFNLKIRVEYVALKGYQQEILDDVHGLLNDVLDGVLNIDCT